MDCCLSFQSSAGCWMVFVDGLCASDWTLEHQLSMRIRRGQLLSPAVLMVSFRGFLYVDLASGCLLGDASSPFRMTRALHRCERMCDAGDTDDTSR